MNYRLGETYRITPLWVLGVLCLLSGAQAQIQVSGQSGLLSAANGKIAIPASLGTQKGKNLFHSFDQFNVNIGQTASFSGPSNVANVISRVTGTKNSQINGTLQSTIPGANVYLINPNGVIFGANARLDVKGSFAASTGSKIIFKDGAVYQADLSKTSSLTSESPEAFGFLGKAAQPIAVNGSLLKVPAGKAISLVGGNLTLNNKAEVSAPSGRINAVSVASRGQVPIHPDKPSALIDTDAFARMGKIKLTDGSQLSATDAGGQGGGSVVVRAGGLTLNQGSSIVSLTDGTVNGHFLDVNVRGNVSVRDGSAIETASAADNPALGELGVTGHGGNLRLTAGGNLLVAAGANPTSLTDISATTLTPARAGNLTLNVGGTVRVTGSLAEISTERSISNLDIQAEKASDPNFNVNAYAAQLTGNGGNLTLNAGTLIVDQRGSIATSTYAAGPSGTLDVKVAGNMQVSNSAVVGAGSNLVFGVTSTGVPGDVTIGAFNLSISSKGVISDTNAGSNALLTYGMLKVNVSDEVYLAHGAISGNSTGPGPASGVLLVAQELEMDRGRITSNATGTGPPGTIDVSVNQATLENHSHVSTNSGIASQPIDSVTGGSSFQVRDSLTLRSSSFLSATTTGKNAAGSIFIFGLFDQDSLVLPDVMLTGVGSTIGSDSLAGGTGAPGEVLILARNLTVVDGAAIEATSGRHGLADNPRGNIILDITDQVTVSSPGSNISASSGGAGPAGKVKISGDDPANASAATGEILVDQGTISSNAGFFGQGSAASGAAGNVTLTANKIVVEGTSETGGLINTDQNGTGAGGAVNLFADSVTLQNNGFISSRSDDAGLASSVPGSVSLHATDQVRLLSGSEILGVSTGASRAGNILISGYDPANPSASLPTGSVLIDGVSSGISSDSTGIGAAGFVNIFTNDLTVQHQGYVSSVARAAGLATNRTGNVSVGVVNGLQVLTGGSLDASSLSAAHAGDIEISGSDPSAVSTGNPTPTKSVLVDGEGSRIFSDSETAGIGSAGKVEITAAGLILQHDGGIATDTGSNDRTAKPGDIILHASKNLDILSGGVVSANSSGAVPAGSIAISAADTVIDGTGGGTTGIVASSNGTASSGSIGIDSQSFKLIRGGSISTASTNAVGGNISISSAEDIQLNKQASINAQSVGGGGRVTLDAGGSLIIRSSGITASTTNGKAGGGDVTIDADFLISVNSFITATAAGGEGGKITNDTSFTFATGEPELAAMQTPPANPFDQNGLTNPFDVASASGSQGVVVSSSPNLSISSTLGQVTYRTPDLVVVGKYPASQKQLAEAKEEAAKYLAAGQGNPVSMPPAPAVAAAPAAPTVAAPPVTAPHTKAATEPRAVKHPVAVHAETPRRAAQPVAAPRPLPKADPGVIAVQVSKKTENSADTIDVILINPVSGQVNPNVYEISKRHLSGESIPIEGQSATLVTRDTL